MYPNLNAEMARARVTQRVLSEAIGVTPSTLSLKLQGKSDFTLKECVLIKKALQTTQNLEVLFSPQLMAG